MQLVEIFLQKFDLQVSRLLSLELYHDLSDYRSLPSNKPDILELTNNVFIYYHRLFFGYSNVFQKDSSSCDSDIKLLN